MDPLADLLRCDYTNLQNVLRDILARLKNQENKIATLENTVREKDSLIERLASEVKDGLHVMNNFSSKYGNVAERLNALEDAVNVHTEQISSLNTNVNDILGRLDKLSPGNDDSLSSKQIKERIENLEGNLPRIDKLEDEVAYLRKHKVDKEELEAQMLDVENSLSNLQQQLTRNANMMRDQQAAITRINSLIDENGVDTGSKKVSASDLSMFVERALYDSDIAALQEADGNHASEIRKIWTAIKKLKNGQDELTEAGAVRDSQISELRTAIGALGKLVNSLTDSVNNMADKRDLMLLRDDMLKQLKDTANTLREHMRNELKRFEGDLMLYLDERENQKDTTETAIGKVYFRCLTCNQPTQTQHGPHSKYYQYTQGNAISASGVAVPLPRVGAGMIIEKGQDVTVHGADGNVYKGREEPVVHFTPASVGSGEEPTGTLTSRNNAQFRVTYADKPDRSAMGSRGQAGTARGVGGAGGNISLNRPQSARLPIGYDESASPGLLSDLNSRTPNSHLQQKQALLTQQFENSSGQGSTPLTLEDRARPSTSHSAGPVGDEKAHSMQLPSGRGSSKAPLKRPATTASAFR